MKGNRLERVAEEIRREVSDILQHRASDPRLVWTSVTRVAVSRDLSVARIHVSVLGDDDRQEEAFRALEKAAAFVRSELGRRVRLRRTPELRFIADPGIEYSLRVNRLLGELGFAEDDASTGPRNDDMD